MEPLFQRRNVIIGRVSVHLVECGSQAAPAVLFLHGWPQTSRAFEQVMLTAGDSIHAVAIDLPDIGESRGALPDGRKHTSAAFVHDLVGALGLRDVSLVGHDVGGQVVFSYLISYPGDLAGAVIMNVVVPGIPPWDDVIRNPYIWHFAFHQIPELPEKLVGGKQAAYFDYFFNAISKHPEAIGPDARRAYVEAYRKYAALKTGFDWYRAFPDDARENAKRLEAGRPVSTPVLCVRGAGESGEIDDYAGGLQAAGLVNVSTALVPDCGH